jgi:Lysyl oxidase/RTX calcium-binding nonapeptide repeat (4 copies)
MSRISKTAVMSRIGLLFALIALALFLAGGVTLAAVIDGTAGDDTLTGTGRSDFIDGYEGNDTIYGKAGWDELWGGFDSDVLRGNGGNDTLHGEGGDDTLEGADGDDELRGADGKDNLKGGGSNDRLYDRDGNTAVVDTLNCGTGEDVVKADPSDFVARNCETVNADGGVDLLPDLGMGEPRNIHIEGTGTQKRLRFSTTIVNVGDGRFEVTGRRPPSASAADMTTIQRIYDSVGDYRERSTTATFFYSGDGHEHWHVKDLEHYQLFPLDDGGNVVEPAVGEGAKNGFCFYDNHNWGSNEPEYYVGCENGNPTALRVTMGLSRGWGDIYSATLPTQYIDITGLADGRYRLQVTADEADWFLESDETNNFTWVDLAITGNVVTVLQYGPSAPQVG